MAGYHRMGPLMPVPDLLREYGADETAILAEAEFPRTLFKDPDTLIPVSSSIRLMSCCARQTGCPHFGLLVGQRSGLAALGRLGFMAMSEATVGSALVSLFTHIIHNNRVVVHGLTYQGDTVTLGVMPYNSNIAGSEFIQDMVMAVLNNVFRELCGPDWRPSGISLSRLRPRNVTPYQRLFRCPIHYNAEKNEFHFARSWLERPNPHSNPELRRIMAADLGIGDTKPEANLADDVRRLLRTLILSGDNSVEAVAARLSRHPRSLHRGLARHGTTFRSLTDEIRYELASHLIRNTSTPLTQIASMIGYAEVSAFSRAFRRWTGQSARDWRRNPLPEDNKH